MNDRRKLSTDVVCRPVGVIQRVPPDGGHLGDQRLGAGGVEAQPDDDRLSRAQLPLESSWTRMARRFPAPCDDHTVSRGWFQWADYWSTAVCTGNRRKVGPAGSKLTARKTPW